MPAFRDSSCPIGTRHPHLWRLLRVTEAFQENRLPIRKLDRKVQLATHGLDIAAQCRKHQVTAFFYLSNTCLADVQHLGQLRLGQFLALRRS